MADDVDELLAQWESMSEHYLAGRTELIDAAIEHLGRLATGSTLVELGAGPGTTLRAIERAHPTFDLIGVDVDPVLRRLHDLATRPGSPIRYVDADLSTPDWTSTLSSGTVDVVLTIQVLHYFSPHRLDELLGEIARLLTPGGLLIHIDHVPTTDLPTASAEPDDASRAPGADPWSGWWASLGDHPQLAEAVRRRAATTLESAEYHPADADFGDHLRRAGFSGVRFQRRAASSLLTIVSR